MVSSLSGMVSYPFSAHSEPGDDRDDPITTEIIVEIHDLLSVDYSTASLNVFRSRLLALLQKSRKLENLHVAYLMSVLGCKLNAMELHNDAEKLHRRALCIGVKGLGRDHPDLTGSMGWLTFSLYRQGHYKEAVLLCYTMMVLVHQSVGSHSDLVNCYFILAMIVEAMGLSYHASVLREKGCSLWTTLFPMQGMNIWCPLEKNKDIDWSYDASPTGYYPEIQTGVWLPAGYGYDSYTTGIVHSF